MAFSVTHVLIVIVILDFFRHYVFGKKNFPRYLLVIGGIAGLFPDIDLPLQWLSQLFTSNKLLWHGTFTHSIFIPIILLLIGIILHYKNKIKLSRIFYVISTGWFIHLILDCIYGGEPKLFFYPFHYIPSIFFNWNIYAHADAIDAIILILWLLHEELHNKIKDYF